MILRKGKSGQKHTKHGIDSDKSGNIAHVDLIYFTILKYFFVVPKNLDFH